MHITKRGGDSAGPRWFALTGLAVAIMSLNAHAQAGAIGQEAQGQAVSSVELRRSFDIAAQPLDSAIIELSRQGDVVITAPSHLLAGKLAPAIRGSYSVPEALRMLLADSGLRYRQIGQGGFVIERPPAEGGPKNGENVAALDAVMVFGSLQDQLSVGSKSGQTLRETPKSVTLVTRERIEAQNLSSLAEALNQTTGVVVTSHSPSAVDSFFYSRGFRVQTLQMDGGAPAFTGGSGMFLAPDTAAYDHIEMLRGVDGMFTGAGQPGGTVNLVRKRAQAGREVQLALSVGSWDAYRGELDVTGALTEDERLRGRMVGAYADKGFFYDRGQSRKSLLFGTVEYDLTPTTLLIAGANYERRKEDGFSMQGHPRYSNGDDLHLPRTTAFNPDWAHWDLTTKEIFARAEQRYGETGVLKLNLTRLEQKSDYQYFIAYGFVDPATLTGPRVAAPSADFDSSQDLFDLSASGEFSLFGRTHRYTVGADYSKVDGGGQREYTHPEYSGQGEWGGSGPLIDVFNFDPSLYPAPVGTYQDAYYPIRKQVQNGVYAALGFQLVDSVRLTLGGRYGRYSYHQAYQWISEDGEYSDPSVTRYKDSKFIPSVALNWDFSHNWSAYASYAETFEVQAQYLRAPLPGSPLDPVTGAGYELGVKGEILNNSLNTALAVYRVTRNGQGIRDPLYPSTPGSNGSSCCYVDHANVTSEGLDAEVSGTVLRGWQLFAGYTYFTNKYEGLRSTVLPDGTLGWPSGVAYAINRVPKHMFKMWTTWQLPGKYSRWTLNAGVIAQAKNYIDTVVLDANKNETAFRAIQGAYMLTNASVQYRIGDAWTVGVYGENLTNKKYYQVLGAESDNTYGTPRSYVLSLRGRW